MPLNDHLLAAFTEDIVFGPDIGYQSRLSVLDTENPFVIRPVLDQLLASDFLQQALPTSDSRTLSKLVRNHHNIRWMLPVQTTIYAPGGDLPVGLSLELLTFEAQREDACLPWLRTCWNTDHLFPQTLELPYEGDEPLRARALLNDDGYHYVLGDDFLPFRW